MKLIKLSIASALLVLTSYGASLVDQLSEALDLSGQRGIQLLSCTKYIFKWTRETGDTWAEYVLKDANGYDDDISNRVTKSVSQNDGWVVQKGTANGVAPYSGSTCVRSKLSTATNTDGDAQLGRLVFKVYGPGILTFHYITASDDEDMLRVYVDGESFFDTGGYYFFADGYDSCEIEIPVGTAESGPYAGTYWHEVIIDFEKDLPEYTENDNGKIIYVKNGPTGEEIYDEESKYFHDCVWIDKFTWERDTSVVLEFDNTTEFTDTATVFIGTNAIDSFGYMVKYTTDGSAPTSTSPNYDTETGIVLNSSATVKASVFFKDVADLNGNGNSSEIIKFVSDDVNTISAEVNIMASAPTISIDKNNSPTGKALIVIAKGDDRNTIRYTLDGSVPTSESTVYTGPLLLSEEATIKAICTRDGISPSTVSQFTLSKATAPIVMTYNADNTEAPSGITSGDSLKAVITVPSGFTVKYGSTATNLDRQYTGAITMNAKSRQTLYFQTVIDNGIPSEIVSVTAYKADKSFTMPALAKGWNLVCIPMALTSESISALLASNTFYGYDENNRCYSRVATLKEGCSYWVFSRNGSGSIGTINGTVIESMQLDSGWLFGGTRITSTTIPTGAKAFKYQSGKFQSESGKLQPGTGYWLFK